MQKAQGPGAVESFKSVFGNEIPDKFTAGTGIKTMYKALPEQTASDLAFAAAENLFSHNPVDRERIGVMIFVTQSPDYRRPSSACVLHKRLGLAMDCASLEVNLGCSGFVYGLQTAMNMMEQSDAEYGLLMIAETASKLVDPMDKSIVMMYGDAGAAILLERQAAVRTCTLLRTDGNRYRSIILPAGGFRDMNPPRERFKCGDDIERTLYDIYMDGTSVFSFSISDVPKALKDYLKHTDTVVEDYDVFLFHQANQFIIRQLIKKLRLPAEKVPLSLDRYGNTGGISIPLTICDRYGDSDEGCLRALMSGFGIGLSWGVTSTVLDTTRVYPIVSTTDYYREGRITPEMLM